MTQTVKDSQNKERGNAKDKHDKILTAAIKVFAKNGFHNSKISQIAQEAGVADGTIYLYFKNKDDILIRLFEERLEAIIDRFNFELAGMESPEEKIRSFIRLHIELVDTNRSLAEVMSVELRQSHKFMKEYVPHKFAEFLNIISRIIREGKDKGVFREDIMPGIIKRALFGALDEIMVYMVMTPSPKYDVDTLVEQCTDIFIRGLRV